MTAPDLLARIKNAAKTKRRLMDLPKYIYPDNVVSAALLGKIAPYVKFEVRASECRRVRKLDNQKGGGVYGGGYLLSDKATARKIEAYEQAAKQATVIVWELSPSWNSTESRYERTSLPERCRGGVRFKPFNTKQL